MRNIRLVLCQPSQVKMTHASDLCRLDHAGEADGHPLHDPLGHSTDDVHPDGAIRERGHPSICQGDTHRDGLQASNSAFWLPALQRLPDRKVGNMSFQKIQYLNVSLLSLSCQVTNQYLSLSIPKPAPRAYVFANCTGVWSQRKHQGFPLLQLGRDRLSGVSRLAHRLSRRQGGRPTGLCPCARLGSTECPPAACQRALDRPQLPG